MVKKAKVFKPGDYVFAKVKGYPAWPAKVAAINGKKYNIYFFGTGETANLPPNDLFDYLENKKTFTAKIIKRKDYNAGLEQIEAEIGGLEPPQGVEEGSGAPLVDVSTADETAEEQTDQNNTEESEKLKDGDKSNKEISVEKPKEDGVVEKPAEDNNTEDEEVDASKTADEVPEAEVSPAANEPAEQPQPAPAEAEEPPAPTTGRAKRTPVAKKPPTTPVPVKTPRRSLKHEPITPKVEQKTPVVNPETISRSGRKIKPKRYMDMGTLDTSPEGTKAKRPKLISTDSLEESTPMETEESEHPGGVTATPNPDSEAAATLLLGDSNKEGGNSTVNKKGKKAKEGKELNGDTRKFEERFNIVNASELEDIKEPLRSKTAEENSPAKENILLCLLPSGKFIGIKLFQDRPHSFGTPSARQIWENNTARNSLRLKRQLESGETKPETIPTQLETDLQLTEDELVTLRKERELEIQRNRLSFFRTENKLLNLEQRIQGALSFNSPDVQSCIQMLTQIAELEVKLVMLLKHPSLVETVKRIRRYVGNPAQWKLSEKETVEFEQKAHLIRKKGQHCYNQFKALFTPDEGKSFFEHFSDLVLRFKKCTQGLTELELLELDEEPKGFWAPGFLTMKAAADAINSTENASKEPSKTPDVANSSKKDKVK